MRWSLHLPPLHTVDLTYLTQNHGPTAVPMAWSSGAPVLQASSQLRSVSTTFRGRGRELPARSRSEVNINTASRIVGSASDGMDGMDGMG